VTEIGGYIIIIFLPNRFSKFIGLFQSRPLDSTTQIGPPTSITLPLVLQVCSCPGVVKQLVERIETSVLERASTSWFTS
jgi:hypothetical protein